MISGPAGNGVYGTWALTLVGGEIGKLQDATVTALSPDGARIAFVKQQRVWQMGPGGEDPEFLFAIPAGREFWSLAWSPDGRWLTYLRHRVGQAEGAVLEAHIPGAGSALTIFEDPALRGFCWLSRNHIVLDRWEAPERPFSNLWEIDVDPKEMKARGKPRRLTNWAGFSIDSMSASRDGKRLAVTKRLDQSDVFIGELADHGDRLNHLHRMDFDDRVEWPGGWSRDSRWLLFQSDRTGHMSIFRQRVNSGENPQPLVTNLDDNRAPIFSPDGQWVLYFAWPGSVAQVKTGRLMRMPTGGGSPELILEAKGLPGSPQTSGYVDVPTTAGHPAFRCPQVGSACVLSEAGPNEIVFYSFPPAPAAAKSEIFRIQAKAPNSVAWDLSPDGSRIAYCERDATSVHVRELGRGTTRDISIPGWGELLTLGWSADGKSLFITNFDPAGSSLLHVTLDGKYRVLYKAGKEAELPKASPNGRSLAFGEVVSASNVWLIEGLPQ